MILDTIESPRDLRLRCRADLKTIAGELRAETAGTGIVAKVLDTLNREHRRPRHAYVPFSPNRLFENRTPIRALPAKARETRVAGLDQGDADATRMRLPV